MAKDKKPYTTGYKKPPKEHRFTKGQSGNPRGRPKGSKNVATLLQEELAQTIVVQEQGQNKSIKKLDAIVKQLVMKALKGDSRAIEYLFKQIKLNTDQETDKTSSFTADPEIVKNLFDRLTSSNEVPHDK